MFRRAQVVSGLAALVGAAFAVVVGGPGPAGRARRLRVSTRRSPLKEKHAERMLDKPGVAGIGVGLNPAGKPVIQVYKEKQDVADIPDDARRRPGRVGRNRGASSRASLPTDRFPRPVPIGVSSGLCRRRDGHARGTRDERHERLRALEQPRIRRRQHREHRRSHHPARPTRTAGSIPADRIGTLADVPDDRLQRRHQHDGRRDRADVDRRRRHGDARRRIRSAELDDDARRSSARPVQKYGRTTGLQQGTVADNERVASTSATSPSSTSASRRRGSSARSPISPGTVQRARRFGLAHRHAGRKPAGRAPLRRRRRPDDRQRRSTLVLQRFGVTIDGAAAARRAARALPPASPRSRATGSVTLSWTAPSLRRRLADHGLQRSTAARARPERDLPARASARRRATPTRRLTNGTTYYYKVSAENAQRRGRRSRTRPRRRPPTLVPPATPLPDRRQLRPRRTRTRSRTRGAGRTAIIGSGETGLYITANWLACTKSTTCTAWRNTAQYGPDVEVWARIATFPGRATRSVCYARLQQPGTVDLRRLHAAHEPAQPGPTRSYLERIDNGTIVTRLTINQELAAGDILLLRAKGTIIEAWRNDGSLVAARRRHRPTYAAAGYAGIGLRGTTGRLDDFGARSLEPRARPAPPTGLAATAGDAAASPSPGPHRPSTAARRSRATGSTAARARPEARPSCRRVGTVDELHRLGG